MKHKVIVGKIIKYIDKVIGYTSECQYESFSEDAVLAEACIFNLSQIGELAHKVGQ